LQFLEIFDTSILRKLGCFERGEQIKSLINLKANLGMERPEKMLKPKAYNGKGGYGNTIFFH
jgi:hypothetical protein